MLEGIILKTLSLCLNVIKGLTIFDIFDIDQEE